MNNMLFFGLQPRVFFFFFFFFETRQSFAGRVFDKERNDAEFLSSDGI